MFSKRAAPEGLDKMAPCKVLKAELADLFLSNDISAQRAQRIFASAEQRQLDEFRDLAKAGKHGSIRGNISRDLTTTMVRGCGWPGLYNAKIPVWDKKKQRQSFEYVPFLLPHEVCAMMAGRSTEALFQTTGLSEGSRMHLARAREQLQCQQLLAVGLWTDGVPCNWDRTQSLEVVSMSFPGLTNKDALLRIPICILNKKHFFKHKTFDSIFKVVTWSFESSGSWKVPYN